MAKQKRTKAEPVTEQEPKAITLERVLEAGILLTENEIFELGVAKAGGRWFKDTKTGLCYRVVEVDSTLMVAETKETKKTTKERGSSTKIIKCADCGEEREVKIQDVFQVTRCKDCQKKYRNKKRAERQKAKRAERRKIRELAKVDGEQQAQAK